MILGGDFLCTPRQAQSCCGSSFVAHIPPHSWSCLEGEKIGSETESTAWQASPKAASIHQSWAGVLHHSQGRDRLCSPTPGAAERTRSS